MKKLAICLLAILSLFTLELNAKIICGHVTGADDGLPIPGVTIMVPGSTVGTTTDFNGYYELEVDEEVKVLRFSFVGMESQDIYIKKQSIINIKMEVSAEVLDEVVVTGMGIKRERIALGYSVGTVSDRQIRRNSRRVNKSFLTGRTAGVNINYDCDYNNESYAGLEESGFKNSFRHPLSTFSIDVDAASYSNIRRFITDGTKPPEDAVRVEEMINYFNYDYPQPTSDHPFAIYKELAKCPWNDNNLLLHIGIQGQKISKENLPSSNLVFLIDVSGSMYSKDKLPLLKRAFKMLVNELREDDRVAIVVYAGSSGLVLPSTSGFRKDKIRNAINRLSAGGSTAGEEGLRLAYEVAKNNFIEGGNNRIILATDGDFNVGPYSDKEMEKLIKEKRDAGIFISVLGFGTGNFKDSKMEIIADKGNGNYSYIDNILEAQKVLINEFGGTLFTIAKDVKVQIEFNPAIIKSYRLLGYENRLLDEEDFDNDKKDAGELGSGHSVTALYEIELYAKKSGERSGLKYQTPQLSKIANSAHEIATVKFRYKMPDGDKSMRFDEIIPNHIRSNHELSNNFKFSAAVASFGMLLKDSDYKGESTYKSIIDLAKRGRGNDDEGYRNEFIRLVKLSEHL